MFYFDIFRAVYQDRIKYLIVGGLAVNLHGVPRVTQDIDIIISTDKGNILKINKILKELNYVPRLLSIRMIWPMAEGLRNGQKKGT